LVRHGPVAMGDEILGRLRAPSVKGYLSQLYALSGWSSLPGLHTLRQPTLVLAGDADPLVPLVNGSTPAWRVPSATLPVPNRGGHLFILERPDDIAELVAAFLQQAALAPGVSGAPDMGGR